MIYRGFVGHSASVSTPNCQTKCLISCALKSSLKASIQTRDETFLIPKHFILTSSSTITTSIAKKRKGFWVICKSCLLTRRRVRSKEWRKTSVKIHKYHISLCRQKRDFGERKRDRHTWIIHNKKSYRETSEVQGPYNKKGSSSSFIRFACFRLNIMCEKMKETDMRETQKTSQTSFNFCCCLLLLLLVYSFCLWSFFKMNYTPGKKIKILLSVRYYIFILQKCSRAN